MDYRHREMIALGEDETPYQLLTADGVSTGEFEGEEILKVEAEGLTMLADRAIRDSALPTLPNPHPLPHLRRLYLLLSPPHLRSQSASSASFV